MRVIADVRGPFVRRAFFLSCFILIVGVGAAIIWVGVQGLIAGELEIHSRGGGSRMLRQGQDPFLFWLSAVGFFAGGAWCAWYGLRGVIRVCKGKLETF